RAAQRHGGRGSLVRGEPRSTPPRRRAPADRRPGGARGDGRVPEALRLHPFTGLLRAPRVLDGPAHVAAREDCDRLLRVPLVPAVRAVRRHADAASWLTWLRAPR